MEMCQIIIIESGIAIIETIYNWQNSTWKTNFL